GPGNAITASRSGARRIAGDARVSVYTRCISFRGTRQRHGLEQRRRRAADWVVEWSPLRRKRFTRRLPPLRRRNESFEGRAYRFLQTASRTAGVARWAVRMGWREVQVLLHSGSRARRRSANIWRRDRRRWTAQRARRDTRVRFDHDARPTRGRIPLPGLRGSPGLSPTIA